MIYLTAADVKAAAARKRGIIMVPKPPVPMAEIRRQLAKKVSRAKAVTDVTALLADGAQRRKGPRSVIVASGLKSDHVSLRLQSPEMRRFEMLLAREHGGRPCPGEDCCAGGGC